MNDKLSKERLEAAIANNHANFMGFLESLEEESFVKSLDIALIKSFITTDAALNKLLEDT